MMPNEFKRPRLRVGGFTLIETIITMLITAILAGMVSVFISGPVKGYINTAQRGDLTDEADLALRRLSREVGLALPNSLRVTTSGGSIYIEFIATSGGGAYLNELNAISPANPLNYSNTTVCATTAANCKFDVVGAMPANPAIAAGDYIVVYNLGQDAAGNSFAPADAYASGDPCVACNRAKVSPGGVSGNTVTLDANALGVNVFAAQNPPLPSPSSRFHVVPGSVKAVAFSCPTGTPGNFSRYAGYGFFSTAAAAITAIGGATPAILASKATCAVSYTANASQRTGLLSVSLTLKDTSGLESVTLMREIHLDNSP